VRYNDGYVFYSESSDPRHLKTMVKYAALLIGSALSNTVPLRVAITQGDLRVTKDPINGTPFFDDTGWDLVLELEKALDWMGGWVVISSWGDSLPPYKN
jgi:hypothetical protein